MAMPWSRAKQIAKALRGQGEFPAGYSGSRTIKELTALFDASFRIQREASAAAGRHIPLIVENVRGAEPWVGRARWNFGSFYLWGDVPALMPATIKAQKFNPDGSAHPPGSWFKIADSKNRGANSGHKMVGISQPRKNGKGINGGSGWFEGGAAKHGSKSTSRKAASAIIAKIPLPLSRHIARTYHPGEVSLQATG